MRFLRKRAVPNFGKHMLDNNFVIRVETLVNVLDRMTGRLYKCIQIGEKHVKV
jgi:hypothetical protein